jgi:magnesium transporter
MPVKSNRGGVSETKLTQLLAGKIEYLKTLFESRADNLQLAVVIEGLYPSEVAYIFQHLEEEERSRLVIAMQPKFDAEILLFLSHCLRKEIMLLFKMDVLSQIVTRLESDDVLMILRDLDAEQQAQALQFFSQEKANFFLERLHYPPQTAGYFMQSEVLTFSESWTVKHALDRMRATYTPRFYDIFVIDSDTRLVGAIELSAFVRCKEDARLSDVMNKTVHAICVDWRQDEIAFMFRLYELISAPVVDDERRIVGIITIDDVMRVVEHKVTEDFMHIGGINTSDFYEPIGRTSLGRLHWLTITVINAVLTSLVIQYFEPVLQFKRGLTVLMPIAAAMGGNSGIQAATVAIRALATRDLNVLNTMKFLVKEITVSSLNGILFGLSLGSMAFFWFQDIRVALVLGSAVLFNMVWAGIAGTLFPIGIARLSGDPALSSGPLLTTTTDVFGYGLFLGLSYLIFGI